MSLFRRVRQSASPAGNRRVLIAHPSPDLYGSDRMLLESVAAFVKAGWDVDVVLPEPGPLVEALAEYPVRVAYVPMPVLRKSYLSPSGFSQLVAAALKSVGPSWRALRTSGPDLVYVNTLTIPSWIGWGRLSGAPVTAHVHEAEDGLPRPVAFALTAPLLLADSTVVNSRATEQVLKSSLASLGARTQLIYNGVVGPPAAPSAVPADRPQQLRLVLVGRLSPRKGSDVAVEAVRLLRERGRDVALDLVGSIFPGYEWFEEELRESVSRSGLDDAVTFRGFQSQPWDALAAAHVALVPSRVEPFGNTSIEAQLALRPVVVSATQGLVETVDDGEFGELAEPGDAVALADAVERVYMNWDRSRERAEQAIARAEADFSPAQYRRKLTEYADALISAAGHGRGRAISDR